MKVGREWRVGKSRGWGRVKGGENVEEEGKSGGGEE